jgi:hypothetical protein
MTLPFNLNNRFKNISFESLLKTNLGLMLWVFLGIVVLAESFVIYQEISKVSQVQSDPNVAQSKIVRVNLDQHKKLEEKLRDNESFQPRTIPGGSSFGVAPSAIPKQ